MVKEAEQTRDAPKAAASLIDHVEIGIEVLLGETRLTVGAMNKLAAGDVLSVDRTLSEAVDIRVNGRTIARGEIVTVDEKFAVRITEIGDL